jgi:hypothetical protein
VFRVWVERGFCLHACEKRGGGKGLEAHRPLSLGPHANQSVALSHPQPVPTQSGCTGQSWSEWVQGSFRALGVLGAVGALETPET